MKSRWWRKKRYLLPIISILLMCIAAGIAVYRSDISRVVLYNNTGETISELIVRVCSQTYTFNGIQEEGSVRIRLKRYGAASDIQIERPDLSWRWQGGYVEPRGGYRSVIHLLPDGQIEENTQISWWQNILYGKESQ